MRLSDFVFKYLKEYGVNHVFTLVGGGSMYLDDSLGHSGIPFTCNLHEQACAISAIAYAEYNNKLGVCLVTTAPGGTNTITGVAGAWLDSVPLLVISGQVKRADLKSGKLRQRGFQELDVVKIAHSITKYAVMVKEPTEIKYHLDRAISLATHGRKAPVWLDIPLDVQLSEVDESKLKGFTGDIDNKLTNHVVQHKVIGTINYLNYAEKPVILVGNGCRSSIDKLIELVQGLNIPILTTWKAMDLFDNNDSLYCGRPGMVGQQGANIIQNECDLLISIGARLDLGQTGYDVKSFAPKAKKIVVDLDSAEIGKIDSIKVPICCDAELFIEEMLTQKHSIKIRDNQWLLSCRLLACKNILVNNSPYESVDTYNLVDVIANNMNESDVLVPASSGQAAEITMQNFRVKNGQRILNFPALGSMGFGICSSIGACLASSKKRTICIEGDGSFAMNTQELETIHRLHLPIKIFVLNNYGYRSLRSTQDRYFNGFHVGSSLDSGLTLPNIRGIAEAYSIDYQRIDNEFRLDNWIREYLRDDKPRIIEVKTNYNQETIKC